MNLGRVFASSAKMLRVYEKGIQLGDLGSPWVRYEVQLGSRDRVVVGIRPQPVKLRQPA